MQITTTGLTLSPTDLAKHLACRHVTALDLAAARGEINRPAWYNALVVTQQKRGLQHEAAYLESLAARGIAVSTRADGQSPAAARDWTRRAMEAGAEAIVQASLQSEGWKGYADVLLRVETPSALGSWSYEVVDTKLARETRGGAILQLSLYTELVAAIQGKLPERMHVVKPGNGYVPESFRTLDFQAYYRFVKKRLEEAVNSTAGSFLIPDPVEQCEICQWWPKCNDDRRAGDHLSFVAGILKLQMSELRRQNIPTLTSLSQTPVPLPFKPGRGSPDSYVKVHEQARLQVASRNAKEPVFETLVPDPGHGFARLPAPSAGDIFFDLESDSFVDPDGLEYLFGYATTGAGKPLYHARWALTRGSEKQVFEWFVDMVMARREQFPDMHVYHFSPYEPAALKRLMGKHATREDEIDHMLRAGVLVDLHLVVRQGLRAGVERYSLKDLEALHQFNRATDLHDARLNLRRLEAALEIEDVSCLDPSVLSVVESYNREDCLSTLQLRNWLETVRQSLLDNGHDIPRPTFDSGDAPEEVAATRVLSLDLMTKLLKDVPEEMDGRNPEQRAHWFLAHMMEWHRREEKAPWWEYFRLRELNDEQLLEERDAVSGLQFAGPGPGGTAKCPVHRYTFPPQDTQIRPGADLKTAAGTYGEILALDRAARIVDIKKKQATANVHASAAFVHEVVGSKPLVASLHRIAAWVIAHGVDAPGRYRSGRDLLLRHLPRGIGRAGEALYSEKEDIVSEARRLVLKLDSGVLPIQGPPGSGKTYTAARMICELVRQGKKVGVTAVGHKVIRKLLDEVALAAVEEALPLQCIQKVTGQPAQTNPRIIETAKNEAALAALQSGEAQVAGGTAWLWAREEFLEAVDVLFVDEAGQMSLADVIAISPGGTSLVLLGDPQQLEQPLQGTHPTGLAVSALQYIIGDRETISTDEGLFLAETWRLAPAICAFTSELFYEQRLKPRPGLELQRISGPTKFGGSGLRFVPVRHEGNQSSSPEEVDSIVRVVEDLLQEGVEWTDMNGEARPLTNRDILIVAPYNAQVFAISERLPEVKTGTVDRFQGQEAPVVIYSMTTSSRDDAPRGMEFLYNVHRLNVATSRARCVCILVANPGLLEPECHSPREMRLANALCRYAELSSRV